MHLTLHITTDCNMNCSYCYSPPHKSVAMTPDTGRRAMDFGSNMMNGESCGIIFFGGEPLLHKDLIYDLVGYGKYLEDKGRGRFHFKTTTNGVLLEEEFIRFSIMNNLLIAMSFDGIREAHDSHRHFMNGKPTFDFLKPKLDMLLELRPYSSILMVVNPDTVQYLAESIKFMMDNSAKYIILSLNYDSDWREKHFRELKKQLNTLADLYIEWTEQERKFYLSPFEVKISSHINRHCYQKERCELAQRQLSVDPQGALFPCVQFTKAGPDSEWCIGHVDSGINEDRRASLYAQSEAEKPECAGCAIKGRCHNTCGCLNWQTTGSINRVSPVLCRYEQILIPIADRIGKILYKKRNALFLHKHYNATYPVLSLLEDTFSSNPSKHRKIRASSEK